MTRKAAELYKNQMEDLNSDNQADIKSRILYEDNHLIVINKLPGELVQGDKTGDDPLPVLLAAYLKKRDGKPGNVFLGVPHRLDRPTSGVLVYAKTSKALSRMNNLFREGRVKKTYWALTGIAPEESEGTFVDYLLKDSKKNKSFVVAEGRKGAKKAVLHYRLLASGDRYHLLEVEIDTGRHHQIRCQLASRGMIIKGDLKYGSSRSNKDGGISLHARHISFTHPVGDEEKLVSCTAPPPAKDNLWNWFIDYLDKTGAGGD